MPGAPSRRRGARRPTHSRSTAQDKFPPLPEGLSLDADNGLVSGAQIGGQGTYFPRIIVTDSAEAPAEPADRICDQWREQVPGERSSRRIRSSIIAWTAATTGLPVDTSPAAPIYSGYLPETVKPFFGDTSNHPFPNGIPAFSVPSGQPDVAVKTTVYQSLFHLRADPCERAGGRHRAIRPAIGMC